LAPLVATHIFHKPDLSAPLRWMSIAILPMNLLTVHVSLLKGTQKFAGATLIESVGVNVVIISLLFVFHKQMTSTIACICFSVSTILASYVGLLVWRKRFPNLKNIKGNFDHRVFIQTSLPLFGVALMNLVMSMSDTIMIGLWHNSYLVGIYGVALRIASVSSMFLVVANTILAPKFSVMFHNEDHIGLSRLAREATILMAFLAAIFLTMFVVFPTFFLGLFGDEFIFGKKILVILAVGQFVVLSTGPVAALLMMTGHEKFHRNTTALSAAMNIILNIVLIPSHGAEGAAFSTAFALALKNILAVMHVRKKMNISLLFLRS
jgi:O-antigen/teichoic acid export membrane protein